MGEVRGEGAVPGCSDQVFLAREVAVQGAHAHARVLGHLVEGSVRADAGEDLACGAQDVLDVARGSGS